MESLGKEITTEYHKSEVEIFDENRGGYHRLVITDRDDQKRERVTTVQYRNVGDKNTDAAVQFEVSVVVFGKRRNVQTFGFSVPFELKDIFLKHLTTEKQ